MKISALPHVLPSSARRGALLGATVLLLGAALALTPRAARAADVYWSVGVGGPGVSVGVGNAPPVYAAPAPVYVAPQPVYVAPQPVYVQPEPVYVAPRPRYVRPAPVYYTPAPAYVRPTPVYVEEYRGYRGPRYYHGHRHGRDWR